MKFLNLYGVMGIGVVALAAACGSSSSGNGGSSGDGGSSSGSASSSGSSSGSASSSGSSSGSASSSGSSSGGTGALPTITITSPTSGESVAVTKQASGEVDVPVGFSTTNFTLKAPGTCGSISKTCGHVHLFVDYDVDAGTSPCTPSGSPYNNDGQSSPINAIMSECANSDAINGPHTVRLELHADDHSPITDASGNVIENTVAFTATGD